MKPARFDYHRPETLDEALALLRELPDAKLLAGGQSLIPMMNFRLAKPRHLVDLARIGGLHYIRDEGGSLAIGAMTRQATVEQSALVRDRCPLLSAALQHVSHYAIRTRGTVGGNLAHADPSSELPVVAVALDAQLVAMSANGRRTLTPDKFFVGPLTVALEPEEILVEVRFPVLTDATGWGFAELSRRHGDFAIVCACALIEVDGTRRCTRASIALGGVSGTPVRCRQAEMLLAGQRHEAGVVQRAAAAVNEAIDPEDDLHASAAYRHAIARAYTERVVTEAWRRAEGRA